MCHSTNFPNDGRLLIARVSGRGLLHITAHLSRKTLDRISLPENGTEPVRPPRLSKQVMLDSFFNSWRPRVTCFIRNFKSEVYF